MTFFIVGAAIFVAGVLFGQWFIHSSITTYCDVCYSDAFGAEHTICGRCLRERAGQVLVDGLRPTGAA